MNPAVINEIELVSRMKRVAGCNQDTRPIPQASRMEMNSELDSCRQARSL
jgi:hypothetical protein